MVRITVGTDQPAEGQAAWTSVQYARLQTTLLTQTNIINASGGTIRPWLSLATRAERAPAASWAMSEPARDVLAELARMLPTALEESALHDLATRLQPLLRAGEPADTDRRLYTATEAAELVGVNIETVRRAIRSGQLAVAGRIGRSPRISRDAIDNWLSGTIEMTENGPRRRPRRRQSVLPEHSLRAAFREP